MLTKGRFNEIGAFVSESQIISSDGYLEICKRIPSVLYTKRDFLFIEGTWRNVYVESALRSVKSNQIKHIVVGHSDISTTRVDLLRAYFMEGIQSISGVNVNGYKTRLNTFPMGVTPLEPKSPLHTILSESKHFLRARSSTELDHKYQGNFYANFSTRKNVRVRKPLVNLLESLGGRVRIEEPAYTEKGRINNLRRARESTFTLCPEGNGVDTHRLWETLYMGGTPVVVKNRRYFSLYSQFPIVILDSWDQLLDKDLMCKLWHQLDDFEWDTARLSLSYWAERIKQISQAL